MAGKPRVVGVVASVMEDAQQKTTRETAVISEAGVRATSHVRIAPMTGKKVEPLPMGCEVPRLEGGRQRMRRGCLSSWMTSFR